MYVIYALKEGGVKDLKFIVYNFSDALQSVRDLNDADRNDICLYTMEYVSFIGTKDGENEVLPDLVFEDKENKQSVKSSFDRPEVDPNPQPIEQ